MFTVNEHHHMPREFYRSTHVRSHFDIITFINIKINVLQLDFYSKHENNIYKSNVAF